MGLLEKRRGRRCVDNLRPFAYQNLSVIYHKIFIMFLYVVKVLIPIFIIHDKFVMHLFTYVPLYGSLLLSAFLSISFTVSQ